MSHGGTDRVIARVTTAETWAGPAGTLVHVVGPAGSTVPGRESVVCRALSGSQGALWLDELADVPPGYRERVTEAQIAAACQAYREAWIAADPVLSDGILHGGQQLEAREARRLAREREVAEAAHRLLSLLRRQAEEGSL